MPNHFLTTPSCIFPIFAGLIAFIIFYKDDTEKRLRNMICWSISAISVPWLFFNWLVAITTPHIKFFAWSLLICIPPWVAWLVLANMGEKHAKISRIVLSIVTLPISIYLISIPIHAQKEWFALPELRMLLTTSMFGLFWVIGLWARDFKFVLFRDEQLDE